MVDGHCRIDCREHFLMSVRMDNLEKRHVSRGRLVLPPLRGLGRNGSGNVREIDVPTSYNLLLHVHCRIICEVVKVDIMEAFDLCIAIIGSGTIGLSFAALHLAHPTKRIQIIIYDPRSDIEDYVRKTLPGE